MNDGVKRIIMCSTLSKATCDVRSLKTTKYVARKDPFGRTNSHVRGGRFTSFCPRANPRSDFPLGVGAQ